MTLASDPSSTSQPVPLLDLNRQYVVHEAELNAAVERVCKSGKYILGPDVEECEQKMATYCRAKHAIGCASGSDALLLALLALDVGREHEVIVPSFTFFATAGSVWQAGATPIFADIEPHSYGLDPAKLEAKITPKTKAIIPVHLYGQCADMEPILNIARKYGLAVIEDSAQAIGAEYHGQRTGTIGDIACFSFYPTKNLGCMGDGGMVTTSNDVLADKLKLLRTHGMRPRYYHRIVGINSRLDSIQAAVLNVKLPHLDKWTEQRGERAFAYTRLFCEAGLDQIIGLPKLLRGRRHVWNQYVVRIPGGNRDEVRAFLAERKISSEIYYPLGLHQQDCFQRLIPATGSLPETEKATREVLALPMFPELRLEEQVRVVHALAEYYGLVKTSSTAASAVPAPNFAKNGVTTG